MRQELGPPVVVRAGLERQLLAGHLLGGHEGPGADDQRGIAQLVEVPVQGRQGDEAGADDRGALQEAGARLLEVEPHGQRIDDFGPVIVVDHLGHRELALALALAEGIEVGGDSGGIKRRAVGKGHARPELEGELSVIGVDLPALSDPGLDRKRVGVLVGELVGDLVEHPAIGVEAARWWVEVGMRLLLQVHQAAALYRLVAALGHSRRIALGATRQRRTQGQHRRTPQQPLF